MMTSKSVLFPRQKLVQPSLSVPSYLILCLSLLLLCDHLPTDSGLLVSITSLLSIFFDLTSYCADKTFVASAKLLIKIGVENRFLVALWIRLHS